MAATLQVGQEAPDFTLRDEQGQEVRLSDLRGQTVVLIFFPNAFSPVCEGEMCEIRDIWSEFAGTGATVFGISRDSIWSLKAWKEAKGLKNRLLSDMNGEVARRYGAWNEQGGFANRLTVVIDKNGKIAWTDQTESPRMARNQRDLVQALAGAR